MAFQAQQAPDYVRAGAEGGKHLASMGSPTMTWALAKRARDEKKDTIRLGLEKEKRDRANQQADESRKFIMDSMKSAIGSMVRKGERAENKAERDKAFDFKKSQWDEGESGRISDLKNSLNEDHDDEMRGKFKALALHNRNRRTDFQKADPYLTGQMGPSGQPQKTFQETSMAEYLKTNPMINQKFTWKMAENRHRGTDSDALVKETNAESSATASAESDEHVAQLTGIEEARKTSAAESSMRYDGLGAEREREAAISAPKKEGEESGPERLETGTPVTKEDTTASDMAEVKDRLMRSRGRKAATLSQGDVRTANARLDSLAKESERAEQIDADDTSGEEAAEKAGEKFLSKLKSDETWGKDVTRQLKEGGSYEGAKASGYDGSESDWDKMREALRDTKEKASTEATKESGKTLTETLKKNKKEETELRELIAKSNVAFVKEQGVSGYQTPLPSEHELRDWKASGVSHLRDVPESYEEYTSSQAPQTPLMSPSDFQQASAEGGPPQATPEEMASKNVEGAAIRKDFLGALPEQGEVSGSRVAEPSKPKTQKSARKLSKLQKELGELTAADEAGTGHRQSQLRQRIKTEKKKLRKANYEEGLKDEYEGGLGSRMAQGEVAGEKAEIAAEAQRRRDAEIEQGAMDEQQAGATPQSYRDSLLAAAQPKGSTAPASGMGNMAREELAAAKAVKTGRAARFEQSKEQEAMAAQQAGVAQREGADDSKRYAGGVEDNRPDVWNLSSADPGARGRQGGLQVKVAALRDTTNRLMREAETKGGITKETTTELAGKIQYMLDTDKAKKIEKSRNLVEANENAAENFKPELADKYFSVGEGGEVTINPTIDEDSLFDTTDQESLSEWKDVEKELNAEMKEDRQKISKKLKALEKSGSKDGAKWQELNNQLDALTKKGNQWAGVKSNPTQFFLNNPDKLKHLDSKDRNKILKDMKPFMSKARKKILNQRGGSRVTKPVPEVTPGQGGEESGLGRNFQGLQGQKQGQQQIAA